jgi:ribosomal protein L40E
MGYRKWRTEQSYAEIEVEPSEEHFEKARVLMEMAPEVVERKLSELRKTKVCHNCGNPTYGMKCRKCFETHIHGPSAFSEKVQKIQFINFTKKARK